MHSTPHIEIFLSISRKIFKLKLITSVFAYFSKQISDFNEDNFFSSEK